MSERGSGRTTQQMKEAPHGAMFVWCNGHLHYPRDLARALDRRDLEIVSPEQLEDDRFRGRSLTGIIVDHAATLHGRQFEAIRELRLRVA
jgi:hypothetical protein